MKSPIFAFLSLLMIVSCFVHPKTDSQQFKKLVWADEFNYNGLPDTKKWNYENGFIRNNELQYYTQNREENIRVRKGNLEITAKKEDFKNEFLNQKKAGIRNDSVAKYTSASINTLNKYSVQYGRIEMRAKLTKGAGVWPAFWMMGINRSEIGWPKCGEIDIMEHIGVEPEHIYSTCHYPNFEIDSPLKKGSVLAVKKLSDDYHIYAVEWNENKIDFFVDNNKFFTFNIKDADNREDNPFKKPFYILLNLAIGGDWGGAPNAETVFPQTYFIDYVRVYK